MNSGYFSPLQNPEHVEKEVLGLFFEVIININLISNH